MTTDLRNNTQTLSVQDHLDEISQVTEGLKPEYSNLHFIDPSTGDIAKAMGMGNHAYMPLAENKISREIFDTIFSANKDRIIHQKKGEWLAKKILNSLSVLISNRLVVKNGGLWILDGKWKLLVSNFNKDSFLEFFSNFYFATGLTSLTVRQEEYIVKRLVSAITMSKSSDNNVIQFQDAYLEKGVLKKGFYLKSIARFNIDRPVFKYFKQDEKKNLIPTETTLNDTTKDFFIHLCNDDKNGFNRLIDILSLIFINDESIRTGVNQIIALYGPTSANGKSTFQKLIANMIGKESSKTMPNSDLGEYYIHMIKDALWVSTAESAGHKNLAYTELLKALSMMDEVLGRQIRESVEDFVFYGIFCFSMNEMFTSDDKSDALLRRFSFFETKKQLTRPKSWFDKLNSDENLDNLLHFLLRRAYEIRIMKDPKLTYYEDSEQIKKKFRANNSSAVQFVEYMQDEGLDIEFRHPKELRMLYETFCDEGDFTVLQSRKFNNLIESMGYVKRRMTVSRILDLRGEQEIVLSKENVFSPEVLNEFEGDKRQLFWVREGFVDEE